jgi:hypothetical protein
MLRTDIKKESRAFAGGGSLAETNYKIVSPDVFNSTGEDRKQSSEYLNIDAKDTENRLEIHTKFVDKFEKYQAFEKSKWKLQAEARRLVGGRLNACYRAPTQKQGNATLYYSQATERAFWHGLMTCGRVWLCPVCAVKISSRRLNEIKIALDDKRTDWMMMTFTIQHHRGNALSGLITDLNDAVRKLYQSRVWKDIKKEFSLVGSISGFEIRYSQRSGWHPHRHIIYAFEQKITDQDAAKIRHRVEKVVFSCLQEKGYKVAAGFTIKESQVREDAYITKISCELTLGQTKTSSTSYSPFQLLELSRSGEKWAAVAFQEYAKATKAKQFIRWSAGLKDYFKVQEMTDKEIADKKQDDDAKAVLTISTTSELWKTVKNRYLQGYFCVIAASTQGNEDALQVYLNTLTDDG